MKLRLSATLFLVLSVTILPWWVIAILAILAINRFAWYYEIMAVALIYDLIYAVPVWHFSFWVTLIFVLLVPFFEWLKNELYVFA